MTLSKSVIACLLLGLLTTACQPQSSDNSQSTPSETTPPASSPTPQPSLDPAGDPSLPPSPQVEASPELTTEPIAMGDSSQTSLDWAGVYQGVVPCASCSGIETTLTLNPDRSYRLTLRYLGESDEEIERSGTFSWNEQGNTITLSNSDNAPSQYLVGENQLIQLDQQGERITGGLADQYILSKMDSSSESSSDSSSRLSQASPLGEEPSTTSKNPLFDTRWQLIELRGEPIEVRSDAQAVPFLLFNTKDNALQGSGGCNQLRGSYQRQAGNRLSFSQVATTQKACADMALESAFLEVLGMVDNYTLSNDQLSLHKAKMAPLMRLQAVEAP
ncbi:MAG: copper resistance protein NlpE N-terminal domain-containing protein [Cyanobacteriota bacterium]|nr:copper resistance protein NlpE N-terminal domain-containing protein [Cyanobacteriota bacterium]